MTVRVEHIGDATLYLADNAQIMADLRGDALVGDPPYGQRQKTNTFYAGGTRNHAVLQRNGRTLLISPTVYPAAIHGDDRPFEPGPWLELAPQTLLWGAHRFADRLPAGSWLVWDKVPTGKVRAQGDGEAAWINDDPPRPMRIYRLLWDGLAAGSAAKAEVTAGQRRVHPTQKPVALMAWCIQQLRLRPGSVIVDPWMGSGSTGVAALRAGHRFVGCEIEPQYFEVACRRIEDEQRQTNLFVGGAT